MNKYPNMNSDNPFASQSKLLAQMDNLYNFYHEGDCYPTFLEVNLTNRCNLYCKWCISGNFSRNREEIDLNAFTAFCKDFKEVGGKALTFSGGGEPTLHSQFMQLTDAALNEGLELGLMTNGVFDADLIGTIGTFFKWVRFSLDTINPALYKAWKGVDKVNKVIRNIEELKGYPCKVGANVNVGVDYTPREAQEILLFVYPLVDYIQFRPVLPRYYEGEDVFINEPVWRYLSNYIDDRKINLSLDKLNDLRNENFFHFDVCRGHCFNPVLDANGDLKVCMYHPQEAAFTMGNIKKNSLKEIWESDQRARVRDYLDVLPYAKKCQICCKLTEVNKFLSFLTKVDDIEDKNFL